MYHDDNAAWLNLRYDDLWIYDKLILSRKLGYVCGPAGSYVPKPAKYIVRPITNTAGMGRGARIQHLSGSTEGQVPAGYFWCEVFEGRHLSIDYVNKEQVLCVEGIRQRDSTDLSRWDRWKKTKDRLAFPNVLHSVDCQYINIETIGGNIIEVHARLNPDWKDHSGDCVIVLHEKPHHIPNGYTAVQDHDDGDVRWGRLIKINDYKYN